LRAKGCLDIWELEQIEIINRAWTLFMSRANIFFLEAKFNLKYLVLYLGTDGLKKIIEAGKHCRQEENNTEKI